MHTHSALWLAALLPALLLFAGCGGGAAPADGGAAGPTSPAAPKIEGVLLDVDGESALVGGVPLVLEETGEVVVTSPDGAFAFTTVPEGDLTIGLPATTPGVLQQKSGDSGGSDDSGSGDGHGEGHDDDHGSGHDDDHGEHEGEDHERADGEVRIRRIRNGERLWICIRIEDGVVVEMRVSRSREGEDDECARRELEIQMQRCDDNPDPDMEGEVELEADCEHQEFEVEVENAEPGMQLEAFVIDPDGNEDSLGLRTVEPDGDAEWRIDTGDGGVLPFGVDSLRALEKHRVRVRDADGASLLCARIPELPPAGDPADCLRFRARARLLSSSDPIQGRVELRVRGCEGEGFRQIFKIVAEHLEPGQEVEFFLEDPDDPGTLVSLGTVIADAEGEAEFELDTADGDELPFGVASVRDLFGLRVEVRDDVTGDLLLEGKVPGLLQD